MDTAEGEKEGSQVSQLVKLMDRHRAAKKTTLGKAGEGYKTGKKERGRLASRSETMILTNTCT